jgi:YcxB-like protein
MPIQLKYTLSFEDYLAAQRIHAKSNWWLHLNQVLGRRILPVIGILMIYLGLAGGLGGHGSAWVPALLMLSLGAFFALYPFYMTYKLKRCFERTRTDTAEFTIEFDEELIRTASLNSKSEIAWAAVNATAQDDNVFLIYLAPAKFLVVPMRVCDEQQLIEVRELCERKVSKRQEVAV